MPIRKTVGRFLPEWFNGHGGNRPTLVLGGCTSRHWEKELPFRERWRLALKVYSFGLKSFTSCRVKSA